MWNFATDSRGKDKAKASRRLESNLEAGRTTTTTTTTTATTTPPTTTTTTTTTTMTTSSSTVAVSISDDVVSYSDRWSNVNRNVDKKIKNSNLKSPWRDEMGCESDVNSCDRYDESSNVFESTRVEDIAADRIIRRPKSLSRIENIWRTNDLSGNVGERANPFCRMDNRAQRFKRVTNSGKKYHWSGTFNDRAKRYSSVDKEIFACSKTRRRSSSNDREIIATDYDYNLDGFDDEKSIKKTKLFRCDKFNFTDERSNESARHLLERRSSLDFFKERFNIPREEEGNHRHRAHGHHGSHRRNGTIEQRGNEKDEDISDSASSSGSFDRVDNYDPDQSTIIDRYKLTLSTVYVRKHRWTSIDDQSKIIVCNFVSFFKDIILFTFLPSLYIAIFIYANRTEER